MCCNGFVKYQYFRNIRNVNINAWSFSRFALLGGGLGRNSAPDDDMENQQQTHVSSSIVSSSLTMAPPSIESLEEFPPLTSDSGSSLNAKSSFLYLQQEKNCC
ncbi:hypothetical protein J6590_090303 [Homalodisca vitripennis]|nr:hypothetical protein J6590_090303 [Homalodisca vitripennis]